MIWFPTNELARMMTESASKIVDLDRNDPHVLVRYCRYDDNADAARIGVIEIEIIDQLESDQRAHEFGRLLREGVGIETIVRINELNATDEYKSICSTNDFGVANQVMCDVLERIGLDFHPHLNNFINNARDWQLSVPARTHHSTNDHSSNLLFFLANVVTSAETSTEESISKEQVLASRSVTIAEMPDIAFNSLRTEASQPVQSILGKLIDTCCRSVP